MDVGAGDDWEDVHGGAADGIRMFTAEGRGECGGERVAMDLRIWQSLAEPMHEELVRLAMATDAKDVAAVARLRKVCADAEIVRAALMLGEARRKAIPKFGKERSAKLWADPSGVEMASSLVVAEHKRSRFPVFLDGFVLTDMCCGIGGDAMALAADNTVVAVDRDPVRAWMAARNAGCGSIVADAEEFAPGMGPVHVDPARRDERSGTRSWRLEDLQPGMDVVRRLVSGGWGGAVKLGPGADLAAIERVFPGSAIEIISENGSLVQCVVWVDTPFIAKAARHATLLRGSPDEASETREARTVTLSGEPARGDVELRISPQNQAARYVYEPDDSVERAELLGVLCEQVGAAMLHPRVGLLTSDALIDSPWLKGFEVLEELVWNERRVKSALEARGAGIVEVKTRGGAVHTDQVQAALRGKGDEPLVVFVLRMGSGMRGIIAKRL